MGKSVEVKEILEQWERWNFSNVEGKQNKRLGEKVENEENMSELGMEKVMMTCNTDAEDMKTIDI